MRVLFIDSVSTPAGSYESGQACEVEDRLASQWIAAGICQAEGRPRPAAPAVSSLLPGVPRRGRRARLAAPPP
jgi:hypothetical protein